MDLCQFTPVQHQGHSSGVFPIPSQAFFNGAWVTPNLTGRDWGEEVVVAVVVSSQAYLTQRLGTREMPFHRAHTGLGGAAWWGPQKSWTHWAVLSTILLKGWTPARTS